MNYKGQLEGFPEHIVNMMLDNQEAQGNKRDVTVFEKSKSMDKGYGGFDWSISNEGGYYWIQIISAGNYDTPIPTSTPMPTSTPIPTQPLQEFKIELLIKKQESMIARFNSCLTVVTLCEEFIKDLKDLQND